MDTQPLVSPQIGISLRCMTELMAILMLGEALKSNLSYPRVLIW